MEALQRFNKEKYQQLYETVLEKMTKAVDSRDEDDSVAEIVDMVVEIAVMASVATLMESEK